MTAETLRRRDNCRSLPYQIAETFIHML